MKPDNYENDQHEIHRTINRILASEASTLDKVQQIVKLGFEEEEVDALVEKYQNGHRQIFYEELPKAEYTKKDFFV